MESEYLRVARQAAAAGASELQRYKDRFSVSEKAPKDLVTEADVAAQRMIQSILMKAFPDHLFLGEEEGCDDVEQVSQKRDCAVWIVDPLDGTVNYVHQLQSYAVSIALYLDGELLLGVIHDPVCREVFWGLKGAGAYANDRPIQTSQVKTLEQSLVACSFSAGAQSDGDEMRRFASVLGHAQAMRRLGSAALNMCYVAAGRLDAYWATSVKPWDVAAGALILQEAGGTVEGIDGSQFDVWDPKFVATGTPELARRLREQL